MKTVCLRLRNQLTALRLMQTQRTDRLTTAEGIGQISNSEFFGTILETPSVFSYRCTERANIRTEA
jgi:hypothetical protein